MVKKQPLPTMIDVGDFCNHAHGAVGEEYTITDGKGSTLPRRTPIEGNALTWLTKDYEDDFPLRLLTRRGNVHELLANTDTLSLSSPFSEAIVQDLLASTVRQYQALLQAHSGGSFCTPGHSPAVFVVQTPYDGGPFGLIVLMTLGRALVRGAYYYTDDIYDLSQVLRGSVLYSGWRSTGFHILVLPVAFLEIHVAQVSRGIQKLISQISVIENAVSLQRSPDDVSFDLSMLSRKLYECSTTLATLERRSVFNVGLVKSIEQFINAAERVRTSNVDLLKAPLEAHKNMIESHKHDIQALPRRIETQQTMIFYLTIHRDSYLKLQIADASRRIAQTSMKDSASMKTIAILTMVFLPGTTVASFFSMTMFNWNPPAGASLASNYIWIYFLVTIPLTLLVMFVWYVSTQRRSWNFFGKSCQASTSQEKSSPTRDEVEITMTSYKPPAAFNSRRVLTHMTDINKA